MEPVELSIDHDISMMCSHIILNKKEASNLTVAEARAIARVYAENMQIIISAHKKAYSEKI